MASQAGLQYRRGYVENQKFTNYQIIGCDVIIMQHYLDIVRINRFDDEIY